MRVRTIRSGRVAGGHVEAELLQVVDRVKRRDDRLHGNKAVLEHRRSYSERVHIEAATISWWGHDAHPSTFCLAFQLISILAFGQRQAVTYSSIQQYS